MAIVEELIGLTRLRGGALSPIRLHGRVAKQVARKGLKNLWPEGRAGSSPVSPTTYTAPSFNGKTPVSKTVIPFAGVIRVRIPAGLPNKKWVRIFYTNCL